MPRADHGIAEPTIPFTKESMKLTGWYYTALRIAAVASIGSSAFAGSPQHRTWVSSAGDDTNICSRTLPCRTLAGAILKTPDGGEINAVDSGEFGGVTINKSITIDLSTQLGGIQVSGIDGVLIDAESPLTVILKGLDLNGSNAAGLAGIRVTGNSSSIVHIENTKISGFSQNGIEINPSDCGTAAVSISHTSISECSSTGGVHADGTIGAVTVSITDTEIHGCDVGLRLEAGARADVALFDFSHNFLGVLADNSAVTLRSGTIDFGGIAVTTTGANAVARLDDVTIFNNSTGLAPVAGNIISFGNNVIRGNTTNGVPTAILPLN